MCVRHKAETDYNTLYVAILLGVGLMVVLVVGVALRQRKEFHTHDGFIQVVPAAQDLDFNWVDTREFFIEKHTV